MTDEEHTIDNPLHKNGGRDKKGRFMSGHSFGFKPGESGNPAGRPVSAKLGDELREKLMTPRARCNGQSYLQVIVHKLLEAAATGKPWAIKEVFDRADGRPALAIAHSGNIGFEYIESWEDIAEHCREIGIDPEEARDEVLRLIASADEIVESEEE